MSKSDCIDNIIFDLGGVLYSIDYWETFKRIGDLLGMDIDQDNIPDGVHDIVRSYNSGSIKTETFLWQLQRISHNSIPLPQKLISAWNSMLIGWEDGIFKFLEELRKNYNLYLYSNINDLHYQHLMHELSTTHNDLQLQDYFDGMAFSHLIKHVKPDLQAFKYVLNLYDVDPDRTLFIDDFSENIDGALESGMKAIRHDNVKSIKESFFYYLELVC